MLIVVALGGNALLRRGEPLTIENQRRNVRLAAEALAPVAREHRLVIGHGNGPQVGLLALQAVAYDVAGPYPLDVLDAQTEGMIGYMIEQELGNLLPPERTFATLLTMVEVDPDDPAFDRPTKFIGPVYSEAQAGRLAAERGWTIGQDGSHWRRVVPSPAPRRILEIRPIRWLLERDTIVIAAGGGGIPTMYARGGRRRLVGVEGVIDKDLASGLLAQELDADFFVMLTDVDAAYAGWGTPGRRAIRRASPGALAAMSFAPGSMGPKVEAACRFVTATGRNAAIGGLVDLSRIIAGEAGTTVSPREAGMVYAAR